MPAMPGPVPDERSGLLAFLAQQRYALRVAAHGLTDERARSTPSASPLSVGGLIKHLSGIERNWVNMIADPPVGDEGTDYAEGFRLGPDETLAGVLDEYDRVAARTEEVVAGVADLGREVPIPKDVPWFPKDVDAWSVRWVLLHLIEETARHAGHADIVRESVDGASAFPLMAAAEGWPETPWMKPWTPVEAADM